MIYLQKAVTLCLFLPFLAGCVVQDGVGRYRVATIGEASRASKGVVLSATPVYVSFNSGAGAAIGGAAGGLVTANKSNSAAVVLAGIVGGAIIGSAIEEDLNRANAHQYVVKLETGADILVVQPDKDQDVFEKGDHLYLVYGYPPKLVRAD